MASFQLTADDETQIHVHAWVPVGEIRGCVQFVHGMQEHGGRYARPAAALNAAGYAVYAEDHRGHGATARLAGDLGYFGDEAGFGLVVSDLHRLHQHMGDSHSGLPRFMVGHSMGALATQGYLARYGEGLAGACLSGPVAGSGRALAAGLWVARAERLRLGRRGRSALLGSLGRAGFNRAFKPTRTEFDWLSRDPAEVDAYIADPLCGFPFTVQGWIDILEAAIASQDPAQHARIERQLPLHVFCGERDPVGGATRGVKKLLDAYRKAGLTRVSHRFYTSGRHEMLNEENRDQVVEDLLGWLDAVTGELSG